MKHLRREESGNRGIDELLEHSIDLRYEERVGILPSQRGANSAAYAAILPMRTVVQVDGDEAHPAPPSAQERPTEDHWARFIATKVEQFDLSALSLECAASEGGGVVSGGMEVPAEIPRGAAAQGPRRMHAVRLAL